MVTRNLIIVALTILLASTIWYIIRIRPEVDDYQRLNKEVKQLHADYDSLRLAQDTLILVERDIVTKWRVKNEIETRIIYAADPKQLIQLRAGLRDSIRSISQ